MRETIDKVSIATAAGHGAAVNLMLAVAALSVNPPKDFDAECWPAFGQPRLQDEGRDPPLELGRYVCGRPDPVQPETLFRKAAELGLHGAAADGWNAVPDNIRLAYELFADVTRTSFLRLGQAEARARPAPPAPPPPKLDETIFEELDGTGAMDADRLAALAAVTPDAEAGRAERGARRSAKAEAERERKARRSAKAETDAGLTAPLRAEEIVAALEPEPPAPEPPLSVGERPVDTARQAKRPHGGRRTKGGSAQ